MRPGRAARPSGRSSRRFHLPRLRCCSRSCWGLNPDESSWCSSVVIIAGARGWRRPRWGPSRLRFLHEEFDGARPLSGFRPGSVRARGGSADRQSQRNGQRGYGVSASRFAARPSRAIPHQYTGSPTSTRAGGRPSTLDRTEGNYAVGRAENARGRPPGSGRERWTALALLSGTSAGWSFCAPSTDRSERLVALGAPRPTIRTPDLERHAYELRAWAIRQRMTRTTAIGSAVTRSPGFPPPSDRPRVFRLDVQGRLRHPARVAEDEMSTALYWRRKKENPFPISNVATVGRWAPPFGT